MWGVVFLLSWFSASAGVAEDTWSDLESLARGATKGSKVSSPSHWQQRLAELQELHPDKEASAALSWLYLFGLPSDQESRWRSADPLVERDIDKAVQIARDGAGQSNCARCFTLLAFIMALGYPPLVGAAHLTLNPPRLVFLGPVTAHPPGPAARRPRDVGAPDAAAAAYVMAAEMGDALGILAKSYLSQKQLIAPETLRAPMANQASCMIPRTPSLKSLNASSTPSESCGAAIAQLGHLATEVVEQLPDASWGPPPAPLMEAVTTAKKDAAFVEHVLADVSNAAAEDISRAAALLEGPTVDAAELPSVAQRHADVPALYARAAAQGEKRAALRMAVEHLQKNDSEKAKPLLEKVSHLPQKDEEPMAAMAQYYLSRFTNETNTTEEERRELAWPHLVRAADLGRPDAELLVAHAHLNPTASTGSFIATNHTEAARRYRRLVQPPNVTGKDLAHRGNLSEAQAFAAYNLAVLSLNSTEAKGSQAASCEAQDYFHAVSLSQGHGVRLLLALERRAARLGDIHGALLLAMLLSDVGHELGHLDAAHLWDRWATTRPTHLMQNGLTAEMEETKPCDLHGWWSTNTSELLLQNVSKLFVSRVTGGGFEMFNVSELDHGVGMAEATVMPKPETPEFQHLHSFLWHTTYDAFPGAAPVPVALQPPGAVPHLVEFHHQRGKLTMHTSCETAWVEGMHVNWTFHRLWAAEHFAEGHLEQKEANETAAAQSFEALVQDPMHHRVAARDWLHCWVRPQRYYILLKAAVEQASQQSGAGPGTWEEAMALTTSKDCPCYGGFACRRGNGACDALAKQFAGAGEEGAACQFGSRFCREVPFQNDPPVSDWAAAPEVCAFYFYQRAAMDGNIDAMHVLSHAHSNGQRGAPTDPAQAFQWSRRAMEMGDLRGHFDVAYSMEFGLGTVADPAAAMQIYRDILIAQGFGGDSLLGKAAASFLSFAASGRYLASRLLHKAPQNEG